MTESDAGRERSREAVCKQPKDGAPELMLSQQDWEAGRQFWRKTKPDQSPASIENLLAGEIKKLDGDPQAFMRQVHF